MLPSISVYFLVQIYLIRIVPNAESKNEKEQGWGTPGDKLHYMPVVRVTQIHISHDFMEGAMTL